MFVEIFLLMLREIGWSFMEWTFLLLTILLAASSAMWEYLWEKEGAFVKWDNWRALQIAFCVARVTWILAGAILGPSLPLFLLIFGALHLVPIKLFRDQQYKAKLGYLIPFLLFSSILLTLIGAAALIGNITIDQIFYSPHIRMGILLAANCLLCVMLLFCRPLLQSRFIELKHDRKQDDLFLCFLWCGVLYVLADSIFCMIKVGNIVAILLAAGNLLLLLLIFLIIRQKWIIARERRVEEEYERLAAERAREQIMRIELETSLKQDAMTRCFSRRYITEYLQKMQGKETYSIAFIDLDGLKKINDEKGHQVGDQLLIRFAEELKSHLTQGELLARIGGDEFLLVFPNTTLETAEERMKALRNAISRLEEPMSFSYGAACGEMEVDDLIRVADEAMYRDKKRLKKGGDLR